MSIQVLVDLQTTETGSLYDDFDMLPPKKIKVSEQAAALAADSCVDKDVKGAQKHAAVG